MRLRFGNTKLPCCCRIGAPAQSRCRNSVTSASTASNDASASSLGGQSRRRNSVTSSSASCIVASESCCPSSCLPSSAKVIYRGDGALRLAAGFSGDGVGMRRRRSRTVGTSGE